MRSGAVTQNEIVAQLDDVTAHLERLVADSELPPRPDEARIDRFLIETYEQAWDQRRAG